MNGLERFRSGLIRSLHGGGTRWIVLGLAIGAISGLAAGLFSFLLEVGTHLSFGVLAGMPQPVPPGDDLIQVPVELAREPRRWVFFLLPCIGGLLSGILVHRFAAEAAGPGTDEMIRSFHRGRGVIRPRVPVVKGLATLLTISGGGSAGKEGPIAQIGAGLGSYLATRLGLSARDRRILLLAGAAGGLGAIFRAPLGSALTAIEVLYREDFESDALVPCVISSVTAYVVFVLLLGGAQIFSVPSFDLISPIEVPGYLLLAVVAVPIGRSYIWIYHHLRAWFDGIAIPRMYKPMLGGLGVGMIGFWLPEVYGAGWGFVQQAIDQELAIATMALLVAGKILATSLTIGSGGSGGVFGPTLFIGGMLGGLIGFGGNVLLPEMFPRPDAYVLVGMASFFAGVTSAPIGAMLMVAEMTGGYELLPPLMLVGVVSIILSRGRSIYVQQVQDRFSSPAHIGDLTINVLEELKVSDVFEESESVTTVTPATGFRSLRDLLLRTREATLPVLSPRGELVGLLTAEQIRPVMDDHQLSGFVVAGDIAIPPVFVHPDDDLYRAHELFRASGCPQIPVVEFTREDSEDTGRVQRIAGMLDYRDMMRAYGRELARRREG